MNVKDKPNKVRAKLIVEVEAEDYIESINTKVYNKFVISKNILETNYYKYVFINYIKI